VVPGIVFLDPRRLASAGVSGVYVLQSDGLTLVETATSLVLPHMLKALESLGFGFSDIQRAVVTHVHLDHAGAAGWLVRQAPHIKVYVHEKGLPHLADPSRLLASAAQVYGSMQAVLAGHGEILPVPEKNLVGMTGGQIDLGGGQHLDIIDGPGHAPHHLCLFEPQTGVLFAGEAVGHYDPETDRVRPAVAPPSFDLLDSKRTIEKIRWLNPKVIAFSQFGPHFDPVAALGEALRQLDAYYDILSTRLKKGDTPAEIVAEFSGRGSGAAAASPDPMLASIVNGYVAYLKRLGEIP
jgi:glyoxylase-like metal-dependent hydrolase (beta-lactamase superfamily II)